MCSPLNKLSNKTNVSYLDPLSCKIQIFKVRVNVLKLFLHNFENLQRFFYWRTMALTAMNMVSAGGFSGASFHLRRCPQGVASALCKKTHIFGSRRSKLDHLTVQILWDKGIHSPQFLRVAGRTREIRGPGVGPC